MYHDEALEAGPPTTEEEMTYWDLLYRPLPAPDPRYGNWKITYTTNTTTPQSPERAPTYHDGFDDGWNANDTARGTK